MNAATNAGVNPATYTCPIGEDTVTIQRPSARKASIAFGLIRSITEALPDAQQHLAEFQTNYRATNYVEFSRSQAALRWPRRPLIDDDENPILQPPTIDGQPNPTAGQPVYVDSPFSAMTEEDWEQSGNVVRIPQDPPTEATIMAMFPYAVEHAETPVYRLLALFTMTNAEVKQAERGEGIDAALDEKTDWLLDNAFADEVGELAATVGEAVDAYFVRKMRALSGRLGKLLRVVTGQEPIATPATPTTSSTNGEPTSPTPADANTDGHSTTHSTPTSESSSAYSDESPSAATPKHGSAEAAEPEVAA